MLEIQADTPQRFDGLGDVVLPARTPLSVPPLHVRDGAEDRQSYGAGHLVGVADFRVGALEQHGAQHARAEAHDAGDDDH